MENITINGHIWFQTASGLRIGEGRAKLLEEIENLQVLFPKRHVNSKSLIAARGE